MTPPVVRILALSLGLAVCVAGCVPAGPAAPKPPTASASARPDPQATPSPSPSDVAMEAAVIVMDTLTATGSDAAARESALVGTSDLFAQPAASPPPPSDTAAYPRIRDSRQVESNANGTRTATVVHEEDHGLWHTKETAYLTGVTPDRPVRFYYGRSGGYEFGSSSASRTKEWGPDGRLMQATIGYAAQDGDPRTGPATRATTITAAAQSLSAAAENYTGTATLLGRTLQLGFSLTPSGGTVTLTDVAAGVMVRNTFDGQWRLSPTLMVVIGGQTSARPLR